MRGSRQGLGLPERPSRAAAGRGELHAVGRGLQTRGVGGAEKAKPVSAECLDK